MTVPFSDGKIAGTTMNFCFKEAFDQEIPDAYQRLLMDALRGDHTLFVSAEETETSWRKIGKVLDKGDLTIYDKGTLPTSCFDIEWIDFEKYKVIC